jgi:hypothetical protein
LISQTALAVGFVFALHASIANPISHASTAIISSQIALPEAKQAHYLFPTSENLEFRVSEVRCDQFCCP